MQYAALLSSPDFFVHYPPQKPLERQKESSLSDSKTKAEGEKVKALISTTSFSLHPAFCSPLLFSASRIILSLSSCLLFPFISMDSALEKKMGYALEPHKTDGYKSLHTTSLMKKETEQPYTQILCSSFILLQLKRYLKILCG